MRVLGIQELKGRYQLQSQEAANLTKNLDNLRSFITKLDEVSEQEQLRFGALKARQDFLHNKLLAVMKKVEVLRCYGVPFTSNESRWGNRSRCSCSCAVDPNSIVLLICQCCRHVEECGVAWSSSVLT